MQKNRMQEVVMIIGGKHTTPMTFVLDQPGMHLRLIGFTVAKGTEHVTASIHIIHRAPETTSEVMIRTILDGEANRDGTVTATIERGAKGARTRVTSHALLLSPKARIRMKPALEILDNDAHASHASTAGTIDADQLFYLTSRGVAPDDARRLLVWGFLKEGLNKISDEKRRLQILKELTNCGLRIVM